MQLALATTKRALGTTQTQLKATKAQLALQQAPVGLLMLFDRDRRDLHTVATVGLAPEQTKRVPRVPIGIGPCGLAVSERRPFVIKDLRHDHRFEVDRAFATKAGYRALSCFPLQARTGPCGPPSTTSTCSSPPSSQARSSCSAIPRVCSRSCGICC